MVQTLNAHGLLNATDSATSSSLVGSSPGETGAGGLRGSESYEHRTTELGTRRDRVRGISVTTPTLLANRCNELLTQGFQFFVVASQPNLDRFDLRPFGMPVTPLPFLAPDRHSWSTDVFLRLFNSMNAQAFGPRGLELPNWVLVDNVLLSSGLFIAACDPQRLDMIAEALPLTPEERGVLARLVGEASATGYAGPIPVAAYCAAPTADRDRWVGWSLTSVVPRSGLAFVTKGLALRTYGAATLVGVTQYDNLALRIHTKFGPARIEAARVGLHTAPNTLVYATDVCRWLDGRADRGPGATPTWLVSAADAERHAEMQQMLDARTHTLMILPPGIIIQDDECVVPVLVTDYADPKIHP